MHVTGILYDDKHIMAVSKRVGQPVIAARGIKEEPLKREMERRTGGPLWVIHRLDIETSGIVLFAKDAATHRWMCEQFEKRQVHKKYLALVEGCIDSAGEVTRPIRAFGSGRMGVAAEGKSSVTRYRPIQKFPAATLLEVAPLSGRRHQIRVHLYSIGHPVMGDKLYGVHLPVGGVGRLMLHALEIEWSTPDSRKKKVRANPPPDFLKVLDELHPKS